MSQITPVDTPGGSLLFEASYEKTQKKIELCKQNHDLQKQWSSFEHATEGLKGCFQKIIDDMSTLDMKEIEMTVGLKAAAEGGGSFWCIPKVQGEANFSLKFVWNNNKKFPPDNG